MHPISIKEIRKNPKALHNTRVKKQARQEMLQGKKPSECDYCWRLEGIGGDQVSDRVYKTVIYDDKEIELLGKLTGEENVNLKTLEVSFERACNFACSYCNPSFSTTWGQDIKQNGPYENLVSDGAQSFQHDGSWAQPYRDMEDNPYLKAFWEWWPELSKTLQEFRVTGGEPLLSQAFWKVLEKMKEYRREDLLFSVNSNLGVRDELITRLIEQSHNFSKFDIYTSCEAVGAQAEYIRDGLEYDRFVGNCERILTESNVREFHIMMTINSLCLFSLTDLLDKILEWKARFSDRKIFWSMNILRYPSFMSPLALPKQLLEPRYQELSEWSERHKSNDLISEAERESCARLIEYLKVLKKPHRRTSSTISRWRDFRSFYEQYDKRRNKSLAACFPRVLTDWVAKIPTTDLSGMNGAELDVLARSEAWVLEPENENPR